LSVHSLDFWGYSGEVMSTEASLYHDVHYVTAVYPTCRPWLRHSYLPYEKPTTLSLSLSKLANDRQARRITSNWYFKRSYLEP
jgi:hypothetical protein